MNLSNTLLFRGLEDTEITSLLNCLDATERSYKKSEVLLSGEHHREYRDRTVRHGGDIL